MKDKKKIRNFQIFSAIFVIVLGTILHFTYKWSGNNMLVGIFSAVNESTWEHLKLIFFPTLITIIIGYFYIGKNNSNFLCAKVIGLIISMLFTVTFFYTYTGILGYNIGIINIITFFVAVLIGEYISYRLLNTTFYCNKKIAVVSLVAILICFIVFTFAPPEIGLFEDPIFKTYGIM